MLDFKKVKPKERDDAEAHFGKAGSASKQQEEEEDVSESLESGDVSGPAAAAGPKAGPTPEQITQIKDAIANASSLDEVAKLERALKAGNYAFITEHIAKRNAEAAGEAAEPPGALAPSAAPEVQPAEAVAEPPADASMDTSG